ncbi:unnamed protein product [Linum tenue]|uniref:Uncharacterized protein n=1 Tax=Linum tenue TaxID=586396 RepID=A0AAV0NS80_9ROSI|nr:unnamed protein product [Linum tenue]
MKTTQFLRGGKRIPSSTASSAAMVAIADRKRKVPSGSCRNKSYVPKRWVHKLRAQWKQTIGWQKSSSSQFSYDICSYSLNFDEGGSLDQVLRSHVL